MAFWLARGRRGQDSDFIQRFDPRFWTVNFPRPMMASVITQGADKLTVDCEFHHEGELCGLIWESEDTHDHPLLAYSTDRDYSRTTLRFHWRSNGLIPLDQPNGPTLTIEGRDATGEPRSWYIRLWNYAVGTPDNADIVLPFSKLEGGYGLPGEAIYPADIDRIFISLVPPGYVADSTAPLPELASASLKLTEIACDGHRPMLEIGDVMVPPHGEQIATAYDDSYNLTPERLLRNIRGLGYRGRILHYLGMSHFFRLEPGEGRLIVAGDGTISRPAFRWHISFFTICLEQGLQPICSLSYEVLAEHCPQSWQQIAHDGEAGRTGWDPPSALLSPANGEAMGWLQSVAAIFTALMQNSGLPVLFQIGEPWWWITADHKPCMYDAAAIAEFGGSPPIIASMRGNLDPAQTALLDQAGAILAESTADLAQAVRGAANGPAEILLLAFTPTILDPEMPELKRANVPLGWARPAFDRLQLEDYDWLTSGADAQRRAAYAEFDARLGYPVEEQDYLSGFVLDPADAEDFWTRIDAGLDEAAQRGIEQRFVWALPQITRDGYTRLATSEENPVKAFDDVLYPLALGRDTGVSPEFSTSVAVTASGHERRNSLWSDARLHFDVGPGIRSEQELGTLIQFFRARRGAARGFRLTDPFDFSSNLMTGQPSPSDQLLGIGDGNAASFALIKSYGAGDEPQIRPISRVRVETLLVSVDGVPVDEWTYQTGGTVEFTQAPPQGAEIRAGFLFDVPVRFAEDRLDVSGANFAAGEAPSVPLVEIREAS
ncbi:hypothetical protein GCM10023115_02610 [Pontixanthobacter gangjinensis]|uniref:TIGR02217 family protein n=1 Tax=Pontixanthobacter gangjinensis TaxID=1028742 RepID=A0A6I4SIX5_9SPHN|nr:DUF2460 domain-containing protein [Pontixanthobacter gangjinensis]MXO55514.1 TIGR02217 family protein [Pontixanthobacter gangjinensis]